MVVNLGSPCMVGRCGTRGYRGFGLERTFAVAARPAIDSRIESSIATMRSLELQPAAEPVLTDPDLEPRTQTINRFEAQGAVVAEGNVGMVIEGTSAPACPEGYSMTSVGCSPDMMMPQPCEGGVDVDGNPCGEDSSMDIGIWALVAFAVVGAIAFNR